MTAMTTTTPSNNELSLLKTDTLGRITTPPEQREALLDLFEKSGDRQTKVGQGSARTL